MHIIHETPTYVLEADIRHDETQDIHTLDLYQTWPTMAKPYRCLLYTSPSPRD